MKLIKENNGVYQFQDSNGVKHSVGANSKKEALSILENRPKPNETDKLKRKLINQVRSEVANRLQATDYKVIRHRDQLELGIETTLTDLEYDQLLKERNDMRIKSNELETLIKSKRSINTLNEIKIEY